MNDPEQLNRLFSEALARASSEEREQYLSAACGQDPELRRAVESLIAAHEEAGKFLNQPVVGAVGGGPVTEGPGMVIGRYKLLQQIGEGGFGLVFMAEQQQPIRRLVALKILKAGMDTKEVVARFEAERQALALMDHPNIARVLDGGTTSNGRPYFVMDLVKGIPITDFCDQHQLSTPARLRLFLQVCAGVQHAHQKGLIHRDLKPSNVLVTVINGAPVPKIIDFGVAKALGQKLTERTLFTRFEQLIGTPAYMSPEQAEWGGVDIDTRSDIYSLGVLLYELLTGTTPFEKETLARAALDEVRRMIRETDPPTPSVRLRGMGQKLNQIAQQRQTEPSLLERLVRGDLDWITMCALEKDRSRRYETVDRLARELERYLNDEPVAARPPSRTYRAGKFIRKHRGALAGIAVVFLGLATGLVLALVGLRQARVERHHAETEATAARTISGYLQSQLLASSFQQDSNSLLLAPYQMAIASLATGATNDYRAFALHVLTPALRTTNVEIQRMAAEVCFLTPEVLPQLQGAFQLTNLVTSQFDFEGMAVRGMAEYRRGNLAQALTWFEPPRYCARSSLASQAAYFSAMIYFRQGKIEASKKAMQQAAERLDDCLRTSAASGYWHEYARAALIRREAERLILGREVSAWADDETLSTFRRGWARIQQDLVAADAFARSNRWIETREALLKALHDPGFDWETAFFEAPNSRNFPLELGLSLMMTHRVDQYRELATHWLDWQRRFPKPYPREGIELILACGLAPIGQPDPLFQQAIGWLSCFDHEDPQQHDQDLLRVRLAYRSGNFAEAVKAAADAEQTSVWYNGMIAGLYDAMARMRLGQVETARRQLASAEQDIQVFTAEPNHDPWQKAMCQVALEEARGVIRETPTQTVEAQRDHILRTLAHQAIQADWPSCVELSRQALGSARNDEEVVDGAFSGAVAALLASDTNSYKEFSARLLRTGMESTNRDWLRQVVEVTLLAPEFQQNLAPVYGLSNRIVRAQWDLRGQLARGILEYRLGNLEAALQWLDGPRYFVHSGLAAEAECFRAMIFHRLGNQAAATNALQIADAKLANLIGAGLLRIVSTWHEYGRAAVARREAERLVLGREVSPPLTKTEAVTAEKKSKIMFNLLRTADEFALREKWAEARAVYTNVMQQPGFSVRGFDALNIPERMGIIFLLAGDVATHERVSQLWSQWLDASPDPDLANCVLKACLIRTMPPNDPIVLQAASWREKLNSAQDDEPLIRAMIAYRRHDFSGVLAASEQATTGQRVSIANANGTAGGGPTANSRRISTVGAARIFRAMALAQLGRVDEGRRVIQQAEEQLAPHLATMTGDYWWDLGLCQLALNEAHKLFSNPVQVSGSLSK